MTIRHTAWKLSELKSLVEKTWSEAAREAAREAQQAHKLAGDHEKIAREHQNAGWSVKDPQASAAHSDQAYHNWQASVHYNHAAGQFESGDPEGGRKSMELGRKAGLGKLKRA
jgi:hypothetical protein